MKKKKNMGVLVDQVFYYDGRNYSTNETLVSFSKSFSNYFNKIIFVARVIPGKKPYPLDPAHFDVISLPYYISLYEIFWHYPRLWRATLKIFKDNYNDVSIYWLRGPHPVSLWMANLCRKYKKPYFLMVGQNLHEQVGKKKFSLKKVLALVYIIWLEKHFRDHAKTCLTFTVGQDLYNKYYTGSNTVVAIISSLVEKDSILRSINAHDKEKNRTGRTQTTIITVGRIEPEKGHVILIDSLSILRKRDTRFFLKIAGTGSAEGHVRQYAKDNGLSDYIEFEGYVPFGPQLESMYRDSDVFVLPSLSEGFPRVIVEALAYGLPVVATKVGGIPYLLKDGYDALLVEPDSPLQLAEAIQRLKDDNLRSRLINNGFNTALGMCAESQQELVYKNIILKYPHLAL